MKLLYYSTAYYSDHGGKIQAIEFYGQLKKEQNLSVRLFPEKKQRVQSLKNSSWKTRLKKNSFFQLVSFYRRNEQYLKGIIHSLRDFQPDVLVMQMDSNFLQIKKIKKEFPNLFICTQINGSHFDEIYKNIIFRNFLLKKQSEAYNLADLNIFVSEPSRKSIMAEKLNLQRDVIVYNGVDLSKFFPIQQNIYLRKKYNLSSVSLILGYVGTLDPHKKIDDLLKVFRKVNGIYPNTNLVIIGDGPDLERLKNLAVQLNIKSHIHFLGWKDHNEINDYLNCFDIAIHHSANIYMSPLKIMEYSAVGLAIIAPNIPAVNDIFEDREDVIISKGIENLELEIKELIENTDLRRRLQSNSELLERIRSNFTWKAYSEKILKNIEDRRTQKEAS